MGVQAGHPDIVGTAVIHGPVQFRQGNAELGVAAGGAHHLVVAQSGTRVQAQEDFMTGEIRAPAFQDEQVVHGDGHAQLQGVAVFRPRGEVGGQQQVAGVQAGHGFQGMAGLGHRHALDAGAGAAFR